MTLATPIQPDTEAVQALARRYGGDLPEGLAPDAGGWNPTLSLLLDHRSTRSFLPDAPLPAGTLETLIAAASSAPTSSNLQAWSVVVITDPDRKARLARLASLPEHGGVQQHIIDAPLFLVWIADLSRAGRVADAAGETLAALGYTDNTVVAALDAAFAAQNALIAAQSLGLGGVYIGAIRNQPEAVAEALNLPPHSFAVVGLAIGHPDPGVKTEVKPRLPQSVVLHRETYDPARDAGIAAHDRATLAFRARQKLPPLTWSALVIGRLARVETLHGRQFLRAALARLGLPLE